MIKKLVSFFLILLLLAPSLAVFSSAEDFLNTNLVQGLQYTVETGQPITYSYQNYHQDGALLEVDNGQLTDSVYADYSAESEDWYRAYRGQSRIVCFDLGSICAVSSVEAGFLHLPDRQIYAPRYINVLLSENGTDFATVTRYETHFQTAETEATRYNASIFLGDIFKARYVRIEYSCDDFTYCDEIRIIGGTEYGGVTAVLTPDAEEEGKGYLKSLGNNTNVVKLYADGLENKKILPYIGYIGQSGEVSGIMFDSAVIIPFKTHDHMTYAEMQSALDLLFADGKGIDALDQTVSAVYGTLGLETSFDVYIGMPLPSTEEDGLTSDTSDIEALDDDMGFNNRIETAKQYVNDCLSRFNEKQYKSIRLQGFFVDTHEAVGRDDPDKDRILKETNRFIKQKGCKSFYESGYLAGGFDAWQDYGFDGAVMSSGLCDAENSYFTSEMLTEYASSAYNSGLGTVISADADSDFKGDDYHVHGQKYESFLFRGVETGYNNSLKLYDVGTVLYDFCYSDSSTPQGIYLRRLYDITYSFIHFVYKNEPPVISAETVIDMVHGDKSVNINVSIQDSDSHYDDIRIQFPETPSHGLVASASGNKTLIYSPDTDFLGEDSFTVCVTDGFNLSETITVKVTVSAPEIPSGAVVEHSFADEKSIGEPVEEPMPYALIVILVLLGGAIFVVPTVMIIKRTKKK